MPFVTGFLRFRRGPHPDQGLPPVSGGYPDNSLPGGGHIDNSLPGGQPGIDNTLPGMGAIIDNELPSPPVGVWPPPSFERPIVPAPPGTPPGSIWPAPPRPGNALPGTPPDPAQPDNTLPTKTYWCVAGIPGIGWRYVCLEPYPPQVSGTPTPTPQA